jgi:hypothetical protein
LGIILQFENGFEFESSIYLISRMWDKTQGRKFLWILYVWQDLRESVNTLRYATKANKIQSNPHVVEADPRNSLIYKLKEEICTLRYLLASFSTDNNNGTPAPSIHTIPQIAEVQSLLLYFLCKLPNLCN